jgi:tartrate/fumarate subfamily iron-sulfur-dependent hydro-lyase beta chain
MAKILELPVTTDAIRELHVGDEVRVRGAIVTAREAAHRWLARTDDARVRPWIEGGLVYHCGPVVARDGASGAWRFVAAGPSASARMEPWEAEVLSRYGVRAVLGKGGMGPRTQAALRAHGAVYLHAVGGLAVTLARHVTRVLGVHLLDELGISEAVWHVEVRDLPAIVTMDAHGESLHAPREEPAPA